MSKKIIILGILTTVLLAVRFFYFFKYQPVLHSGQKVSFTTQILSQPASLGTSSSVTVSYGNWVSSVPLKVVYPLTENFYYGQKVKISGKIVKRVTANGRETISLKASSIQAISGKSNILLHIADNFVKHVSLFYNQNLSSIDSPLLLGIVLGQKGTFSKQFLTNLQSAGVMHVIAASGMNTTLVAGFLFALLTPLLRRKFVIFLTLFGIIFYAMLCGLQASIIRAIIMAGLALTAQIFGKQYSGMYILFLTAIAMLFFNPVLIFDIGFQLSMLATWGIVYIKPLFPQGKILDDLTTTFSAQLATLPILVGNFGIFNILSVIVNLFVLWTIAPLTILGALAAFFSFFLPGVATLFLQLSIPLLWFFESVVNLFAQLPTTLSINPLNLPIIVGYYAVLFSVVESFKRIKVDRKILPLTN